MILRILHMVLALQICLLAFIESYSINENSNDQRFREALNSINNIESEFDSDVCESSICESTGNRLKANLNTSVDPCDDFHEFACGGWLASHTIPENTKWLSSFTSVQDLITIRIKDSLNKKRDANDSIVLQFVTDLYKSCSDIAGRNLVGLKTLKSSLDSIGGWPLISNQFNEHEFDWKHSLSAIYSEFNESPVFKMEIWPDFMNPTANSNIFVLGSPTFGINKTHLTNQAHYQNEVKAYKNLILQSAQLMGAKNDTQTVQQIEEMVAFEAKIANASMGEAMATPETYITFSKLNDLTENTTDWVDLINSIYSKMNSSVRVKSDEKVMAIDIHYYKEVSKLMKTTSKRVIANYFAWNIVLNNAQNTNESFRELILNYKSKLPGFVPVPLWQQCIDDISTNFGYILSRLYIESSFTKKDKKVAKVLISDLKESFNELMKSSDWLDTDTRNKALLKLNAIRENVGFPDWIFNNTEFDIHYDLTKKADPKNWFENMLYLKQKDILKSFNSLRTKNDVKSSDPVWPILPHIASLVLVQNHPKTLMTFTKLNNLTENKVNWIDIINKIYTRLNSTVQVKSDELVFVANEYFKEVLKIIEKSPKKVVANYLAWKVIMANGGLTNPLKDILPIFFMDCYMIQEINFGNAIGRLYIDSSFTKNDKQKVTVLVNDIKESFNELMKTSDWLDADTKSKAIFKLNAIRDIVGYPNWILNNTLLDNSFNLTKNADPKTFFKNMIYLKQRDILKTLNSIRKENIEEDETIAPYVVNAEYVAKRNIININAGILNPPHFDGRLPAHINYGAIGQIIGHELTHAFDDTGSKYDAKGNLVNWFTDKVKQRFNEKVKCFVDQYNNILEPQINMKLNGSHTAGENIADNGGIREAFSGYLNYVKKHGKPQLLPHISQYTVEQQFFISYANTACSKYTDQYLKNLIMRDPHSPNKYRVNLPLANFQTFSDVFKCPSNSRMNRKDKCVMW